MPADTPFDPCKQWLGFDAVHLGNYRLVLALSPDANEEAVRRAAEARIRLLQSLSPGPFELARNSLIKRIEEARDAVLTELAGGAPSNQAAGFAMPRPPSQLAASSPPAPSTAAPPQVPAAALPVPGTAGAHDQIVIRTTMYRKRTPVAGIAVTILALAAAVGGLSWFKNNRHLLENRRPGGREGLKVAARTEPVSKESPSKPVTKPKDDKKPLDPTSDRAVSTAERGPQRSRRTSSPADDEVPVEPLGTTPAGPMKGKEAAAVPPKKSSTTRQDEQPERMVAKPSDRKPDANPDTVLNTKPDMKKEPSADDVPTPEPPTTKNLDAALEKVFAALRQQEHDAVEKGLEAAGRESADAASRKRLNAWKLLAAYAKGYSGYRDEALDTVAAGDEYDYKNQKISIVEADRKVLKFRVSGETKTFARDKIPSGIVLAIVTRWFDDDAANDLYLGAHHLAKPEPDLDRAREHWEKADARGAEATDLLFLLDDPVIGGAVEAADDEARN